MSATPSSPSRSFSWRRTLQFFGNNPKKGDELGDPFPAPPRLRPSPALDLSVRLPSTLSVDAVPSPPPILPPVLATGFDGSNLERLPLSDDNIYLDTTFIFPPPSRPSSIINHSSKDPSRVPSRKTVRDSQQSTLAEPEPIVPIPSLGLPPRTPTISSFPSTPRSGSPPTGLPPSPRRPVSPMRDVDGGMSSDQESFSDSPLALLHPDLRSDYYQGLPRIVTTTVPAQSKFQRNGPPSPLAPPTPPPRPVRSSLAFKRGDTVITPRDLTPRDLPNLQLDRNLSSTEEDKAGPSASDVDTTILASSMVSKSVSGPTGAMNAPTVKPLPGTVTSLHKRASKRYKRASFQVISPESFPTARSLGPEPSFGPASASFPTHSFSPAFSPDRSAASSPQPSSLPNSPPSITSISPNSPNIPPTIVLSPVSSALQAKSQHPPSSRSHKLRKERPLQFPTPPIDSFIKSDAGDNKSIRWPFRKPQALASENSESLSNTAHLDISCASSIAETTASISMNPTAPPPMAIASTPAAVAHVRQIHTSVAKRIATLDYIRKAHEGRVYWLNTLLFTTNDIHNMPYYAAGRVTRRASAFIMLGFSLPALLDVHGSSPSEYLRALGALMSEFDTFLARHSEPQAAAQGGSFSRGRVQQLFKRGFGPKPRRASSSEIMWGVSSSGNASGPSGAAPSTGSTGRSTPSNHIGTSGATLTTGASTLASQQSSVPLSASFESSRSSSSAKGLTSTAFIPPRVPTSDTADIFPPPAPYHPHSSAFDPSFPSHLNTPLSESYSHLFVVPLPFAPDYYHAFSTVCDCLIDVYSRILELVPLPESVDLDVPPVPPMPRPESPSGRPHPAPPGSAAGPKGSRNTSGSHPLPPLPSPSPMSPLQKVSSNASHAQSSASAQLNGASNSSDQIGTIYDLFCKADAKVKKLLVTSVVREFESASRTGARDEVKGVGRVVLGGLMG